MANKYLVTGATGNLGNSIVRKLLSQGKDIRTLVLPWDKGIMRIPRAIEIFKGDVLKPDDLHAFFKVSEGTEIIVIHCAGIVSTSWNYSKLVYDVNVRGTQNIVNQCIKSQVRKMVYISSVHALPELPKGQTITETTKFNPDKIIGFYGKTKAKASQIVMDAVTNQGLYATLVFPTGLCGPFDYSYGYVTQLLIDCATNKLPTGIEGGYNFVDVRDVAAGVISACSKGIRGEGYILGNRYVPVSEIIQLVHEQTGSRIIRHMSPIWAAYALLPIFSIYYRAKKHKPLFTRYALYTLKSNSDFSIEKARKKLNYTVRPFKETISDTLEWLKLEGKI